MKNIKPFIFLGLFTITGVLLAVAAYPSSSASWLRIFWSAPFLATAKILCVIGFILLIFRWATRRPLPQTVIKLVFGIFFLPLLLLPIFRCYFKIPYIFCRACPNQCPWGLIRTFLFNSFILLNLSGKFWCASCCPFGTFQEGQARLSPKRFKVFSWVTGAAYGVFFLMIGMYFLTVMGSRLVGFFEIGRYEWVGATVLGASVIFATAFFIPKFWCRFFCPIGMIAEFTSSVRSFLKPSTSSGAPASSAKP